MVPKEFQCKRPRSEIGEGERTPTGIFLPFAGLFSHHPTNLPLKLRLLHVQTVTEIRPFAWSRSFLPRAELLAVSFLSPYQQHPCCCQVFGRCRYLSFFLSFFFLFWKSLLLLTLERPRSYQTVLLPYALRVRTIRTSQCENHTVNFSEGKLLRQIVKQASCLLIWTQQTRSFSEIVFLITNEGSVFSISIPIVNVSTILLKVEPTIAISKPLISHVIRTS